ncbi:S-protein homolog 5-like [Trifolium pratense]|uniref:S-protein homolog 5-like n=1 Tax=Trifolium pratense TaxID=57577 RepID=UPI001E6951C8|nr:S-protein homolog 5-like [Trifolium pratense]XP_045810187.1 S-protein homolog 5-like [Trifolium pratense]
MASTSNIVLLVSMLLTILVALQFKDGKCFSTIPHPVHVYVTNNLTGNLQLGVHCKDKHDDFGYRITHFQESYNFTVHPTFMIPNKLYWCSFSWINGAKYFDIYVQKRDQEDCDRECHWQINAYGPCKVKVGSVQCFPWNAAIEGRT